MKIIIEMDTEREKLKNIITVLNSFKGEKIQVKEPLTSFEPEQKAERPSETFVRQIDEMKAEIKTFGRRKNGKMFYPLDFQKRFVKFYNDFRNEYPNIMKSKIAPMVGIKYQTSHEWLDKKFKNIEKKTKISRGKEKLGRNKELLEYCNAHPYDSWEEVGDKFKISGTSAYSIAKKMRVRIMKRAWAKYIEPTHKYEKPKEEVVIKQPESPVEHFLKFEYSKKPQGETIQSLNECIQKGTLTYKDDGDKFGYDRRVLPPTEWFNFMTEVAQKVNRMMGIDVTLEPTMTGILFKKKF